jgi:tRNA U34 5-methylaminomethyl-2-thiouridine-forming methyltransferase MnmC
VQKLILTSDGSHTIYVPELNEHYHSIHGALQESEYIFIDSGYKFSKANPLSIFEAGFGTGLNAFLTLLECEKDGRTVNYTSIEKYPLENDMIEKLNYSGLKGERTSNYFKQIHSADWNRATSVSKNFNLLKIHDDLVSFIPEGQFDLIYFDAFGPDKQPEVWTKEVFMKISSVTVNGGIFVTYSAKGEVKRILKACGFDVTLLPGPPGKRQIIRAIKI